jgi:hypothetical protein
VSLIFVLGPVGCLDELAPLYSRVVYDLGPYDREVPRRAGLTWDDLDGGLVVLVGPLRMAEHDELRWPLLLPRPELEYLETYVVRIGTTHANLVTVMGHPPRMNAPEVQAWWSNAGACDQHGWSGGHAGCEGCAEDLEAEARQAMYQANPAEGP